MLTNHPHFAFSFEREHLEINPNGIIIIGIDSKTPRMKRTYKAILYSFRRMVIYFHEPLVSREEVEKLRGKKVNTRCERRRKIMKKRIHQTTRTALQYIFRFCVHFECLIKYNRCDSPPKHQTAGEVLTLKKTNDRSERQNN